MKNFFLTAVLAAVSLTSCMAQDKVKQPRQLSGFEVVSSSGGIDVVLRQGSNTTVVVEASPEAQKHLVTKVEGKTLKIGWESNYSWRNLLSNGRKANVYITLPRLTGLSLSGGADATGESNFSADNFRIDASGGSDIKLSITAKTLSVQASGGSDVNLTGRVERQKVDVSGGSDYNGFALQSTTATISASGGSDAKVSVDGEISSDASGGSDVRYKGDARVASSNSSGGGSVRRVK
ncbi:head GIN domain-containing protein [Hymenobacter arizonensis]|uniref:Putative auto-transporter adhesin, head GIN domain n=1 Tax=Hymenobacter arizonensis TaxID=1227077 RepID=A0A1I5WSY1_HYMAR|nr:head GIN domain-containing protein [Hymenobacter arizonensis]SFQ22820.1 Putative auto-transporter adhesin, head GIN domain [Hymenobacter arizonensis]